MVVNGFGFGKVTVKMAVTDGGRKRVARIGRGKINCKYWHSFGQSGWENCGHKKVGLAFKKKKAHCRIFLKYVKIKKHIFFNIFGHDPKLFLLDRDRTGH
jgi:hypothetical protein